ncbi:hypothetical protein EC973_001600 [Apophysomyces ossiformis]|uniref:Uncharacterized protein n=1 Tax=Apophysomyces ossiformis TaxID=679940 RepID=A0A8H7BPR9_9FUNG|nr:hypothetical protein EC973_001600 [Apophysomyces ossiformis]
MPLRLETEDEIKRLSDLRGGVLLTEDTQLNRTDDVLDEVCQMLSLCFLSLGKTRESPAVYSQVVAIKHCFDRLDEFGIYAEEFLEPYEKKLKDIEQIITIDERNKALPEAVMQILKYKFLQCKKIYARLLSAIHEVSPELLPIRNRLLRIRRQLIIIACKSDFKADDILPFQEELREIDGQRVDGKFIAEDGSIPAGQAVIVGLLDQDYSFAHDLIIATQPDFSPALQSLRERLVEIKQHLERLELTHKWTLRQTDLFSYQHQLHDIVKMRHDDDPDPERRGKFVDEHGQIPEGQTVLNFLLHKCYRMILILLIESVPVSEALTPIYNQLTSVRQCLIAVKEIGAPCSPEELYPYQMKLASIDQLRKDGKFYDDRGHIPEGQALCVSTLEECYHILDELREEEEPKSETDIKSEAKATS